MVYTKFLPPYIKQIDLFSAGFTLAFTLITCFILFFPPQIGIANSGDFGRIIDIFDLYYVPDYSNFTHFYDTFVFGRPYDAPTYNGYIATSSIFILISIAINKILTLFSEDNIYYIYSLSLCYLITYIISFYHLIRIVKTKVSNKLIASSISCFAILVLTDTLFIEYFNSFFQEGGFIVCLSLFISIFLRFRNYVLDVILLTLIIFSKQQNLIFILLTIPLFIKYGCNLKKAAILGICLLLPLFVYTSINTYAKNLNNFSAFFNGVLHKSTKEEGYNLLSVLNKDTRYSSFSGQGYWGTVGGIQSNKDAEQYQLLQGALQDISRGNIITGYMLNPSKMMNNIIDYLNIVSKEGTFAPNLGNYKVDQENKTRVESFHIFSDILKNINYVLIFNFILSFCIFAYYLKNKNIYRNNFTDYISIILALNITSLLAIPVNIIGDGLEEPIKHFLEVYYTESILLILNILTGLSILMSNDRK